MRVPFPAVYFPLTISPIVEVISLIPTFSTFEFLSFVDEAGTKVRIDAEIFRSVKAIIFYLQESI